MGQPDRVLLEAQQQGETARFVFRTPAGSGSVWVEGGQPVDAALAGVGGERALVRILWNRSVRFSREEGQKSRSRRILRPLSEYIEEARQRSRQWADLAGRLPPLSAVLVQVSSPALDATSEALAVLGLVDGEKPLFAIIDESNLESLVVLRAIDELVSSRVLSSTTAPLSAPDGALADSVDLRRDAEALAGLTEPQTSAPESPVFPLVKHSPSERPGNYPAVGRYEVLGRLGRGGMATVYLCRTRGEGGFTRRFAMKVLRTHLSDDSGATDMLLREARFTGRLHHPNVVSVVDVGSNKGQPYLVMDYVAGCSAATLLEASSLGAPVLDDRVAAAVTLDALAGLHAAHTLGDTQGQALGLVHQDVSPENLLVGFDGVTRVSDFGVAQVVGALSSGEEHGKPQYLAPERVLGRPFDQRADIFALGVVFYRLLTGVEPFAADSPEETMQAVLARSVELPSTVGRKPPAIFDAVCMRALEKNPNERFQTAEHFRGELLRVAVVGDRLALAGEVADAARRAVDALAPGSRLAEGEQQKAPAGPGAAIVLLPRTKKKKASKRTQHEASAGAANETVQLETAKAKFEPKPLPIWAVAVFLLVSIGLALALESLGGDDGAPPRVPEQAQSPAGKKTDSDDPFGPGFLEDLGKPDSSAPPEPSVSPPLVPSDSPERSPADHSN